MKKIIVLLMIVCIILFTGCSDIKIDFKSIYDTESKKIFSLGDTKASIDKILGASEKNENYADIDASFYSYLSGSIAIYYKEDIAIGFDVSPDTSRFLFKDFNFDMTIEEVEDNFEWGTSISGFGFYYKYYDKFGNNVSNDQAEYFASIMVSDKGDILRSKGEIISFSIYSKDLD